MRWSRSSCLNIDVASRLAIAHETATWNQVDRCVFFMSSAPDLGLEHRAAAGIQALDVGRGKHRYPGGEITELEVARLWHGTGLEVAAALQPSHLHAAAGRDPVADPDHARFGQRHHALEAHRRLAVSH